MQHYTLAIAVASVAIVMGAGVGQAQIVVESRRTATAPLTTADLAACEIAEPTNDGEPLVSLEEALATGQGKSVRRLASCLLGRVGRTELGYDFGRSATVVTWVGFPSVGAPTLRRVLLGGPPDAPLGFDLPGVSGGGPSGLHEVFLALHRDAVLQSTYASMEQQDPFRNQIPDVVARVLPALYGTTAAVAGALWVDRPSPAMRAMGALSAERTPRGPRAWLHVHAVALPSRRASLVVKSAVSEPRTFSAFKQRAQKFGDNLSLQLSSCGIRLATDNARRLGVIADAASQDPTHVCAQPGRGPECLKAMHDALRDAFVSNSSESCRSRAETAAMVKVDTAYRNGLPELYSVDVKAEAAFRNAPPDRVSFGLSEALMIAASLADERVRLNDDDVLGVDPLPRTLTLVTVNVNAFAASGEVSGSLRRERIRGFVGAAIKPDFGVAVGVSWLPVSRLSLNVGHVWLFTRSLARGDAIGQKPVSASDPFGLGHARAWFAGVGFEFK